ncbi:hypothetical protein F4821DRAFT_252243 [Hypoxylon rubiginosum]|uniref:Uncharacterized protein n=1 Tax=Hypoxylon rubiginosum TaxID=110542 RepID=A0ACC0CI76_9PEZI|nr:hypothetical protein F4821DRAFT_252243 [Hypoxylon rubiginosum]
MKRVITQSSALRSLRELLISRRPALLNRPASSQSQPRPQHEPADQSRDPSKKIETVITDQGKKKTMAELDAEMRQKMSGLSGDGGEAGVEYEDGQPVAMKRSVKNNMFRYI